jgi:hypothetical protein
MDNSIQDPLLEPHKVSGGFNKFTRIATKDTSGNAIKTTGNEPITSGTEIDDNRPTIRLEMNVAWVNLDFLASYVDTVNNATWWTLAARKLKCSEFNWERVLYGTCRYYFHVMFGFEIKRDTWDFVLANYGRYRKVSGSSPATYELNRNTNKEDIEETWLDINGDPTAT